MSAESGEQNSRNHTLEERKGQVRSWSELSSLIPPEVSPREEKLLRTYFRVQLRIAEGRTTKAKEIMKGLDSETDFKKFELKNEQLFAAIEIVVRGNTNRRLKGQEPAFIFKKSN